MGTGLSVQRERGCGQASLCKERGVGTGLSVQRERECGQVSLCKERGVETGQSSAVNIHCFVWKLFSPIII